MQMPHTDSAEYADLLDFIATGGRCRDPLHSDHDLDAVISDLWAPRARAMSASIVAMAKAAVGPRPSAS